MHSIVCGVSSVIEISRRLFAANMVTADRFPRYTAARTVKLGLFSGLAMGILQDGISLAKGQRLGYIEFLLRRDQQSFDARSKII